MVLERYFIRERDFKLRDTDCVIPNKVPHLQSYLFNFTYYSYTYIFFSKTSKKRIKLRLQQNMLKRFCPKNIHLKLLDMAAAQEGFTKEFCKKLIQRQLEGDAIEVTKLIEENKKRRANITNLVQDI